MQAGLRAISLALGLCAMAPVQAEVSYKIADFGDLQGWAQDDHAAALAAFQETCPDLDEPDWQSLCAISANIDDPRAFFQLFFRPVLIEDGAKPLFTGYFEPELNGALRPDSRYRFPLYKMPPEARSAASWLSRREIETTDALVGRGLEIAWVDDPVDLFFLQVQGSGRIRLPDGRSLRVGYQGANGHQYRSVGTELVRRGIFDAHQVSAQVIKNWVRRNPIDGLELLRHNPSYVFFREIGDVPAHKGPLGAMNRSVTTLRSVAVDPRFVPLGAPVWLEKAGETPMNRLMVAQDTGSAIKSAQRADIFFGTGDEAGRQAGRLRDGGRMYVLLPIQRAYALLPEAQQ